VRALGILVLVAGASLAADSDLDPASPEVLQFVRDAQSVYIFPWKPHSGLSVDTSRVRLLSRDARDSLVGIIGDPAHWENGFLDYIVPGDLPPNVGILFRRGADELALFCRSPWGIQATFHGKRGWSDLTDDAKEQLEKWKQRYASKELKAQPRK
jgi:hypothetical protein